MSEIIGWHPATTTTKVFGLKGDELNLNIDDDISSNPNDRTDWGIGEDILVQDGKKDKLSEIGHGQVPFMRSDGPNAAPAAPVSFSRVTQRSTLSFAQLRRTSLGSVASPSADAAMRTLVVALGIHAYQLAFGRGFALRSGAELRPRKVSAIWLGADEDETIDLGTADASAQLLHDAREHAAENDVPLDGWTDNPVRLTPRANLAAAIRSTWPALDS
ncbi:MAG: hypothetical protein OXG05_05090 [Gammaproteobacteria bacterium]|nr:hypothetical protein [Gammaproteobacteria bacterium]